MIILWVVKMYVWVLKLVLVKCNSIRISGVRKRFFLKKKKKEKRMEGVKCEISVYLLIVMVYVFCICFNKLYYSNYVY